LKNELHFHSQDAIATSHAMNAASQMSGFRSQVREYYTLTKPEVNLLILMSTSAGYYLASQGPFRFPRFIATLLGTLLVASGTATLNQFMERFHDAKMRRTANRPAASGRLSPQSVFWFGQLLSVAGGAYLALAVNPLTALLALSTLLGYLLVYTPLKRKTSLCTLLGAIPGAMPVLIGWAGASGRVGWNAWFLFTILFLWQFPHFLAIALMYREDYERAGFRMLPGFDRDGRFTRAEILTLTVVLLVVTLLPQHRGSSAGYLACMLAAGCFFLYHALRLAQSNDRNLAGRVLHASVVYLPMILGIMVVWKP
jgi:heme o synthase